MTLRVVARSDLGPTTTARSRPARPATEPPGLGAADEDRGHLEDRAGVGIAVAAHLLAGHVEAEDDARGARRTGGEQLLVQLVEERALVVPRRVGQIGRDVDADALQRGVRERRGGELADHDFAGRVLRRDVLVRAEGDERSAAPRRSGGLRPAHRAGHRHLLRRPGPADAQATGPPEVQPGPAGGLRPRQPAPDAEPIRPDPEAVDRPTSSSIQSIVRLWAELARKRSPKLFSRLTSLRSSAAFAKSPGSTVAGHDRPARRPPQAERRRPAHPRRSTTRRRPRASRLHA